MGISPSGWPLISLPGDNTGCSPCSSQGNQLLHRNQPLGSSLRCQVLQKSLGRGQGVRERDKPSLLPTKWSQSVVTQHQQTVPRYCHKRSCLRLEEDTPSPSSEHSDRPSVNVLRCDRGLQNHKKMAYRKMGLVENHGMPEVLGDRKRLIEDYCQGQEEVVRRWNQNPEPVLITSSPCIFGCGIFPLQFSRWIGRWDPWYLLTEIHMYPNDILSSTLT